MAEEEKDTDLRLPNLDVNFNDVVAEDEETGSNGKALVPFAPSRVVAMSSCEPRS